MKMRLVFPNPTVLYSEIRSDPPTAGTALPPCCCGGDGQCWPSDKPGQNGKQSNAYPVIAVMVLY